MAKALNVYNVFSGISTAENGKVDRPTDSDPYEPTMHQPKCAIGSDAVGIIKHNNFCINNCFLWEKYNIPSPKNKEERTQNRATFLTQSNFHT